MEVSMQRNTYRYAWLALLVLAAALACNLLSGIGSNIREARETGQSVITEVQGLATQSGPMIETARAFATNEGSSLVETAQAIATDNPGLLETAKSFVTEGLPELGQTLEAAATEHPELAETMKAASTDYAGGSGGGFGDIPADIPMVDQTTVENLYVVDTLISYTTSLDYKTVRDYYKEQMTANGWVADENGSYEVENTAMLSYGKPDRIVNIIITGEASDNKVSVVIQISNK
jgi:hypothetical protein